MRHRPPFFPVLAAAAIVVAAGTVAGCGNAETAARPWTATVRVDGRRAVITVAVPGWHVGADYHPHFSLSDGPEVMAYTETYTFSNLKPGSHTVRVIIADSQHRPIRGMEKRLTFTVPSE